MIYFITILFSSLFKASTHLIWSVFGLTNLETMESRDNLSTAVVGVLYVMFLILSVIMLVNMLVALLTNTYNKVEVSNLLYPIFTLPQRVMKASSKGDSLLRSVRIDSVQTFKELLKVSTSFFLTLK